MLGPSNNVGKETGMLFSCMLYLALANNAIEAPDYF
jgi:hypothetical protein